MKRPHQYDPNSFADLLELETHVDCSNNNCKKTHIKVREGWAFWYTDEEGNRAIAIFCSLRCLFACTEPNSGVH